MNLLILNTILAIGFSAVLGEFSLGGFVAGFVVGYLALWVTRSLYGQEAYFNRLSKVLRLIAHFLWQLVVSNLRVLWDVITPYHTSRPGIIGIPLDARTDMEITLVANLVSLTPGTLSLDISEDRSILYVHVMFMDDIEVVRAEIKNGIERRVLEVFR
ncbi:MAG: Na+/H+ antiporter subunit E [Desulfobacterales bacterium]|jgi:multicomponent Na+:H+ antiporter subunit E|nr:Na+/H+ antiporter subunit E [Desulfobacterales bacterium]